MSQDILIDRIKAKLATLPKRQFHDGVVAAIMEAIAARELEPGSLLPSEREFSALVSVSRNAIRRALSTLESEGIVATRHGHGTFVPRDLRKSTNSALGFSEEMTRRGLLVSSRTIRSERRAPKGQEAIDLGVGPDETVLSLVRLRLAGELPIAVEYALLPSWAVDEAFDGGSSLYAAMEAAKSRPVRVLQEIGARAATVEVASNLGVAVGDPVLRISRKGWDSLGRTSEYTESLFHSERYTWITELRK